MDLQVRAFFKRTAQGLYVAHFGSNQMRNHQGGQWTLFHVPTPVDCGGTWDAASHELYVRTRNQMGFIVLDTTTDTIVRMIIDPQSAPQYSQMGSLSGDFFYVRSFGSTLRKINAKTDRLQSDPRCNQSFTRYGRGPGHSVPWSRPAINPAFDSTAPPSCTSAASRVRGAAR